MDANTSDAKKIYIEFLRIIAAFLVIVNHTNSNIFLGRTPSLTWVCSLAFFFVSKIAVPVFLLIMGGLMLGKEDTPQKTWARLRRILVVIVFSGLFYYVYFSHTTGTPLELWRFPLALFQKPRTVAFWYLYVYVALLCMLPILQKLVKALNRRQLEYLLIFSLVVTGTPPLLTAFFPEVRLSEYFTMGLIGPYIGLALMGYYIERYVPMKRSVFWGAFVSFVLLIAFQVGGTYLLYQRDPSSYLALDDRTMITTVASAVAFYICVKYLFTQHPPAPLLGNTICHVGKLTLGVYLLSDVIRFETYFIYSTLAGSMHPLAAVVLWDLFIFATGALITALLRLIPFLRKWL